jgi:hypothetical protein
LVKIHWGASVEGGTEVGTGTDKVEASACMAVNYSEFLQCRGEGSDMMLAKHMYLHLGLEAAY